MLSSPPWLLPFLPLPLPLPIPLPLRSLLHLSGCCTPEEEDLLPLFCLQLDEKAQQSQQELDEQHKAVAAKEGWCTSLLYWETLERRMH